MEKGPFNKIIYFTKVQQEELNNLESEGKIEIFYSLPGEEEFLELAKKYCGPKSAEGLYLTSGLLTVFDDWQTDIQGSFNIFFQVYSRHFNTSIYFLQQTLYHKNPIFRSISLNTVYFIIYKNVRDKMQFRTFSNQVTGANTKWLHQLFDSLTERPYGYLFIDLTQECPEYLRFRSHVLEAEGFTCVYTKKQ